MNGRRTLVAIGLMCLAACSAGPERRGPGAVYEYKVMSLWELFGDTAAGKAKIAQLMVQGGGGVQRTDMDVADYQQALDKMAGQGWELATISKSNYWIFKRTKGPQPPAGSGAIPTTQKAVSATTRDGPKSGADGWGPDES